MLARIDVRSDWDPYFDACQSAFASFICVNFSGGRGWLPCSSFAVHDSPLVHNHELMGDASW